LNWIHGAVRPHERERRLVPEVAPLAAEMLMRFRQERHRRRSAGATLHRPRNPALAAPQMGRRLVR